MEIRWAEGWAERYVAIATSSDSRSIATYATPPTIAAKQAATVIPIVSAVMGDPVGAGLVTSLGRPGGNVTGLSNQTSDLAGKRLELVREVFPNLRRLAILANVINPAAVPEAGEAAAFEMTIREKVEALHVLPTPVVTPQLAKITDFAIQHRLPTMSPLNVLTRQGLLMSYGYDPMVAWRRAGSYVDRIFKGANPAELPVEQLDQFQHVINLKTARAIGFDPTSLLFRADEVIE